jgi:hypothetical protein
MNVGQAVFAQIKEYGGEYALFLEILGRLRKNVLERGRTPAENKKIFEAVGNSEALDLVRGEKWDDARQVIVALSGENIDFGDLQMSSTLTTDTNRTSER